MKVSKVFLTIVLVALLGVSWISFALRTFSTYSDYKECIIKAEESVEKGLYEQAVEYYKDSLIYRDSDITYMKIKDTYELLYAEEKNSFVRSLFMEDMVVAAGAFPENAVFWETQIQLYLDELNYTKAFETVNQAMNYGANSDELQKIYRELLYMVDLDFKLYYDYKTALNGYISVNDGNRWLVIDEMGEKISGTYQMIGLLNDDGKGVYVNNIDARILDNKEITRTRFRFDIEDAGYYNENSDLLPVKVNGVWKYVNSKGEFNPGKYEIAGSYYNKQAVAYNGKNWLILDEEGKEQELKQFEEIKLDLYGCHIQNGVIIAKEKGKYHLYDDKFVKIGNFEADDIDLCIDGKMIAFKKGDKWGYVNPKGEVIIEPKYVQAKSFANKYAAVCNKDGEWGFINEKNELVVDYAYLDAMYFNSNETCLVSTLEGTVQMLHFKFD